MPSLCQNIKAEYERLLARKDELLAEMERVKEGGDISRLKQLLAEVTAEYEALDEKLYIGWTLEGDLNEMRKDVLLMKYYAGSWVYSVALSPDGESVVMGSGSDKMMRVV